MQKVLIRADSSSEIGLGHIMRDLVLAKRFFKNYEVIFVTQNLKGNINYKIEEEGYRVEEISSNSFEEFDKIVKKYTPTTIVIDHYGIDYEFEKKLKQNNKQTQLFVLDDTYQKHFCDILLNHNIYANKESYKELVPKWCKLLCGSKYTLIRDEFYKEKAIKREKIYDIFLAMGGADTTNVNIPILKNLPDRLEIVVVTTSSNKNLDKLKDFIKNKNNITLKVDSKEIAKLINQSKFAIITPSVIVHEVLFMGLDFLAIKTANNQEEIYKYLMFNKYLVMEKFDNIKFKKILAKVKFDEDSNYNIA